MPHPDFWTWKLKITHEKVAKDILQPKTLNETLVLFFFLPFWFWVVEFHLENVKSCFEGGKIPKRRNRSTISLRKSKRYDKEISPQNYLALMGHSYDPCKVGPYQL